MYITRTDIGRKSTVAMYNLDKIPAKILHNIRVYSKNRNSRQVNCERHLLKQEAWLLKHRQKELPEIKL